MTGDTLTPSDLEDGCPWCDDYDGDHVPEHASQAHPEEWSRADYRPEYDRAPIGFSVAAREAAREAKHEDETWDDFLLRLSEEPPRIEKRATLEEVKQAVREEIGR